MKEIKGETIDYVDFMVGMMNAPYDRNKCNKCGGIGSVPLYCCSGHDCGCHGQPVDYEPCDCGIGEPSAAKIKEWAKAQSKQSSDTVQAANQMNLKRGLFE